ncbi:MAG: hypothetical protein DME51_01840 [Verrucomicrobia bacterium]|nr:MAG: hypothetical protein DME51_01840 [Verrucomicrobiota bacterium]
MNTVRRVSYVFLCIVPFLCFVVVGVRAFRVPGIYQAAGVAYFAAIAIAAWTLSAGAIRADVQGRRLLGLAGTLLITPFALVALLWVGLGGPWQANPTENQMRYLVLIVMATAVAGGFVVLREALSQASECFYATLGFAAIMLGGPLYLIWNTFAFGVFFAKEHTGEVPQALRSLDDIFDLLLFVAGFLTYLATVAFAASLGRVQWLGRRATRAFMIVSGVALLFLVIRGLHYPDPRALSTPWYTSPGFVVGIPAVPFIMPFLFGVVLLRRAGEKQSQEGPNQTSEVGRQ